MFRARNHTVAKKTGKARWFCRKVGKSDANRKTGGNKQRQGGVPGHAVTGVNGKGSEPALAGSLPERGTGRPFGQGRHGIISPPRERVAA